MTTYDLQVAGMTCDHCARAVEKALSGVAGVERSRVSYQDGLASVDVRDTVDAAVLVAAIQAKGYAANLLNGEDSVAAKGTTSGRSFLGAVTCGKIGGKLLRAGR